MKSKSYERKKFALRSLNTYRSFYPSIKWMGERAKKEKANRSKGSTYRTDTWTDGASVSARKRW